jgi:hypothetical protein
VVGYCKLVLVLLLFVFVFITNRVQMGCSSLGFALCLLVRETGLEFGGGGGTNSFILTDSILLSSELVASEESLKYSIPFILFLQILPLRSHFLGVLHRTVHINNGVCIPNVVCKMRLFGENCGTEVHPYFIMDFNHLKCFL